MAALLPATCLWGASFPLALAAARSQQDDAGHLVGRVYAANTLGAIVGAIGFSMVLIPLAGKAFSTTFDSISLAHQRFDGGGVRGWGAGEKLS